MTKVLHLASPRAGTRVQLSAQALKPMPSPASHALERSASPIERQAAIEDALSMALYFIRQPGGTAANLWATTARTNRALTLLKQASQDAANYVGRA